MHKRSRKRHVVAKHERFCYSCDNCDYKLLWRKYLTSKDTCKFHSDSREVRIFCYNGQSVQFETSSSIKVYIKFDVCRGMTEILFLLLP